jgi:ABC-type thiamin/hydroxymethylpyrimidine transport system permease subunit
MVVRTLVTKALAVVGTVLLLLPLPVTTLASLGSIPRGMGWRELLALSAMDLSPAVLLGGCLLLFAVVRAHSHLKPVAWGLGFCASVPVTAIILSAVTAGRALTGMSWYIILGATAFWVGAIFAGISGLSMLRALFSTTGSPARG